MYLVGIVLFGFGWIVFSVTKFCFTIVLRWPWRRVLSLNLVVHSMPRRLSPLVSRMWKAREGALRNFCSVPGRADYGAIAQSGNGSWQLVGTEVLGRLTGQGQKQETLQLIGTCPGIHIKEKWQVRTWCDLKVMDHWAKNRQQERKHCKSIIRQTEDFTISPRGSFLGHWIYLCQTTVAQSSYEGLGWQHVWKGRQDVHPRTLACMYLPGKVLETWWKLWGQEC